MSEMRGRRRQRRHRGRVVSIIVANEVSKTEGDEDLFG